MLVSSTDSQDNNNPVNKKRVVFVSGNFNILHPGHLRLLRFAKDCGDYLIVGVQSDQIAGVAAHVQEQLRVESVQSNSWVDQVLLINESIPDLLRRIKPDIVVKGKEHENASNIEFDVIKEYGGRLLFSSGEASFSSLDLIRKEFKEFDPHSIRMPRDFMARHNISTSRLAECLGKFSKLKVCVIGDLIVDEYITCEPLGMSQEDPTIVVTPVDSTRFIGGAGIVAAHAASLGAQTSFISVTGADSIRDFAFDKLKEFGVSLSLLKDESRPTTLKQRYRCKGKSLLRVSHLHQDAISAELQMRILTAVEKELNDANVLVFSDFNYGCLPQLLVDQIISMARARKVILAADSQSSSQLGDISRFHGMDLLTPTEREARISLRNHESGLVVLAEHLRQQAGARNVLLKLGEEGLLIHANEFSETNWLTDRIEALNLSPKDVAGAGDSLLITGAMTLASEGSIWEAACLGSLAAAIQVGRVGNKPIRSDELMQEILS
jgi:rfaE bifunctional protein kinase chain/domain